jgi:hypothetical protein
MVHMSLSRAMALSALVLLAACHFEDHTPTGSRRDEAQIREVVVEFYRGLAATDWGHVRNFFAPEGRVSFSASATDSSASAVVVPADSALLTWARLAGEKPGTRGEARIIRADLRQVDGIAAVWVTVRLDLPFARRPNERNDDEGVEHLVLHRTGDGWRIVLLSLPWAVR